MQTDDTPIKRRADGSIDTEHYTGLGRDARADAIGQALSARAAGRGLWTALGGLAVAVFTTRAPGA